MPRIGDLPGTGDEATFGPVMSANDPRHNPYEPDIRVMCEDCPEYLVKRCAGDNADCFLEETL